MPRAKQPLTHKDNIVLNGKLSSIKPAGVGWDEGGVLVLSDVNFASVVRCQCCWMLMLWIDVIVGGCKLSFFQLVSGPRPIFNAVS